MKSVIARRVHFSSGHKYFQPKWDEAKNKETFGSCYSEHGHGHNYILEAYFSGPIQPESGMVINLVHIDEILNSVVSELDHQHLNFDVEEFKQKVPTTENIANYCFTKILSQTPSQVLLEKVRLYEEDNLWVDVYAD